MRNAGPARQSQPAGARPPRPSRPESAAAGSEPLAAPPVPRENAAARPRFRFRYPLRRRRRLRATVAGVGDEEQRGRLVHAQPEGVAELRRLPALPAHSPHQLQVRGVGPPELEDLPAGRRAGIRAIGGRVRASARRPSPEGREQRLWGSEAGPLSEMMGARWR